MVANIESKSEEQLRPLMEKYYFIPDNESFADVKVKIVEKLELLNSAEEITVWVETQNLENLKQNQDGSALATSFVLGKALDDGIELPPRYRSHVKV